MIRRLLIANRGEIAIRIARGARELGISPAGVYSDADEFALFRSALDASIRIGPGPARESYLDGAAVVAAARALDADAVHPGYGFLSERAAFAQAVLDAGLIFVGPSPAAIDAMGSKSEAKRRARAAGVPVIDGYDGADQSDAALAREAALLGTPLVIKAVAGGGGRGMRVVTDLATFDVALASARREAAAAFGDDAVLLERYLHRPRHIEVQILADAHGTVLHIGDRDCSIQRRHQKVVEEAPAPGIPAELRERMGAAAVAVARSVGYTNAGTVEFLLGDDGTFAFLEMNARLQVEHPVTECAFDIDLVHEQLRIAAGEALTRRQSDVIARGAAIEVRLNAEDPQHDYAPQAGTIAIFRVPAGDGIRIDTGVASGSAVPVFYDSLLAKVIASGDTRALALERLSATLNAAHVTGIATNLPLLRSIASDDAFARGSVTTAYLDERAEELARIARERRAAVLTQAASERLRSGYAWRQAGIARPLHFSYEGEIAHITAEQTANGWRLAGDITAGITTEGTPATQSAPVDAAAPPSPIASRARATAGSGNVTAPMPGKIVSVAVKPGDTVMMHDLLILLEAMKMEHRIDAPIGGIVGTVLVAPGDVVAAGAPLVTIGAA